MENFILKASNKIKNKFDTLPPHFSPSKNFNLIYTTVVAKVSRDHNHTIARRDTACAVRADLPESHDSTTSRRAVKWQPAWLAKVKPTAAYKVTGLYLSPHMTKPRQIKKNVTLCIATFFAALECFLKIKELQREVKFFMTFMIAWVTNYVGFHITNSNRAISQKQLFWAVNWPNRR